MEAPRIDKQKASYMILSTEEIWEQFSDRLKLFILKRVRYEYDAEDILQEVFAKIHANLPNLRGQEKVTAWVYQITRNAIIDYYRRQGSVGAETSESPEDIPEDVAVEDAATDIASCLKPMIDDLPEKYRQVITLTEYDGLNQREISEELGMSLSGAKSRVQRSRGKLKDMLLECCHFEFDRLGHIVDYQSKEPSCRYCPKS